MSAEQEARDLLEQMGVDNAQSFSSGDIAELANLIAENKRMKAILSQQDEQKLGHTITIGNTTFCNISDKQYDLLIARSLQPGTLQKFSEKFRE